MVSLEKKKLIFKDNKMWNLTSTSTGSFKLVSGDIWFVPVVFVYVGYKYQFNSQQVKVILTSLMIQHKPNISICNKKFQNRSERWFRNSVAISLSTGEKVNFSNVKCPAFKNLQGRQTNLNTRSISSYSGAFNHIEQSSSADGVCKVGVELWMFPFWAV